MKEVASSVNTKRGLDYMEIGKETVKMLDSHNITNGKIMLLYGKILSLSNRSSGCTAKNGYFADILCTTERNIRKYIDELKDVGLIKIYEEKENPTHTKIRHIYPQKCDNEYAEEEIKKMFGSVLRDSSLYNSVQMDQEEQMDHEFGPNGPKSRNKWTEIAEQMDQNPGQYVPPIDKKRIDIDKNREGGSYEPYGSAGAPPESASVNTSAGYASLLRSADAALAKEREFKFDGAFDNETIKDIILNTFELDFDECSNDLSSWRKRIIKEFTNPNGCYRCSNYDDTEEYIGIMMNTLKSYMQRND